MTRVRFSTLAREDLFGIWSYVASHDLSVADRVFDRIEESCLRLRDYPRLGKGRLDIARDARALIIERWVAFYRITEDGVQVVRVVDAARDLANLEWPPFEGEP